MPIYAGLSLYDSGTYTYDAPNEVYNPLLRVLQALASRALIARQQGWPIINAGETSSELFTDTSLFCRARLTRQAGSRVSVTSDIGARIKPLREYSLTARSRIVSGQSLQTRAWILPQRSVTSVACTFDVRQVAQSRATMIFYTKGYQRTQGCLVGAYVVPVRVKRATGHFLVKAPALAGPVMLVGDPQGSIRKTQTLGIQARVVH